MSHYIKGVYVRDREGLDIVVIGGYSITPAGEEEVTGGSAANFNLKEQSGQLLIHRLEVYSVSS